MKFAVKAIEVDAIQWTGENLASVQAFLAPASPCYQPGRCGNAVGLYTRTHDRFGSTDALSFAPLQSWIVREISGTFTILSSEEFDARFTPLSLLREAADSAPAAASAGGVGNVPIPRDFGTSLGIATATDPSL